MSVRRAFLTADAVGGVWTYARELAAGLTEAGVETTLAVLGPKPRRDQLSDKALADVRIVVTDLPLDWMEEDLSRLSAGAATLVDLAEASRADIVHLNMPALAADAEFAAPVIGGCHSCLATWWSVMRQGQMPDSFQARAALLARGYAACSSLVAPTAAFARLTRTHYGITPRVVHNGVDPGRRKPDVAKEAFVLTSGRLWDEAKNFAGADVVAARMRHPLYAAGDVRGPNQTAAAVRNARALGRLTSRQLDRWLNRAAAFLALSRYEPFGLGPVEAAQAGCALVLSDIPSFRELWDGAAVFVAPDDAEAAARALDRLLEHEDARRGMAERATERARRFSRAAMTQATLAIYQDVAAKRTRVA